MTQAEFDQMVEEGSFVIHYKDRLKHSMLTFNHGITKEEIKRVNDEVRLL